jgi:hypothetical protein
MIVISTRGAAVGIVGAVRLTGSVRAEWRCAIKWFQLDSDAPNDPRLKAIRRRGVEPNREQSAVGALVLLWCYVANQGASEPGLGVQRNGEPLDLELMAVECFFDSPSQLTDFLDYAAQVGHIHQRLWTEKRIVFLPAMWERVSAYYRSKARKMQFATGQQVVDAVLSGPLDTQAGPKRPRKAPAGPTVQTRQTLQTEERKSVGPAGHAPNPVRPSSLLDDNAGPDQVQQLVVIWNTERTKGPKIQQVPDSRRRQMLARLKDHPNLDDWRRVVRYVNGQRWCNAPGTGEHPNWRMDIDFLLRPGKFQAALERLQAEKPAGEAGQVGRDASRGRTGYTPGDYAGLGKAHETSS